MKLYDLLKKIKTISVCDDCEINRIVSDSRTAILPGDLFVCITGATFDGHQYAADMLAKGAAAIVVERDLHLLNQVIVPDTRSALSLLFAAIYGNPTEKLHLLGVTGTSGKTSVTFMLKAMLDTLGKKTGLIGTVKCMVGNAEYPAEQTTPEPEELQKLFSMMAKENCEYAVMEVSSQAISQKRVDGCRFEVAGFTNFSQDHLDYHGTMQEYLNAKKPLFTMADRAVSNADDPYGHEILEGFKGTPLFYSTTKQGTLHASAIKTTPKGTSFTLTYHRKSAPITVPILGDFTVYNVLLAIGVLLEAGFAFDAVCKATQAINIVPGRLEQLPTDGSFTILLDYAHKPDAMEKVLRTARGFAQGRVVILFGCGGNRDRQKRPIMGRIAEELADFVYVTSDNPRHEDPNAIIDEIVAGMRFAHKRKVICDRVKAIQTAIEEHQPGDCLILAGKGHETYQKIGDQVLHFDEREIVAQIISEETEQ